LSKHEHIALSCVRSKISYESKKIIPLIYSNKTKYVQYPKIAPMLIEFNKNILEDPLFHGDMCHVVWDRQNIYVNFAGTREPSDMLQNIDIRHQAIYKDIRVHKGYHDKFFNIEESLTKDIMHIIKEYPIKSIIFTGHSSGGAVALISSPYYGQLLKKMYITTHSFASTCVGNIHFLNWFNTYVNRNHRLEVEGDVIPYIPVHDAFYHVPNGILLKNDGTYETLDVIEPYSYIKIISMLSNKKKRDFVNLCHSCDNYIMKLSHLHLHNI